MNFPLRTAFGVSQRFWIVVSSFSFVSRNFFYFFSISLFTHSLFNSVLFNLHEFECFWVFSLRMVSSSIPCSLWKWLIWFQFSWSCWGLFCALSCGLSWKCSMCIWKECVFCFFGMEGSILSPFDLGVQCHNIFVDILFGRSIHFWQWGVKIS